MFDVLWEVLLFSFLPEGRRCCVAPSPLQEKSTANPLKKEQDSFFVSPQFFAHSPL